MPPGGDDDPPLWPLWPMLVVMAGYIALALYAAAVAGRFRGFELYH